MALLLVYESEIRDGRTEEEALLRLLLCLLLLSLAIFRGPCLHNRHFASRCLLNEVSGGQWHGPLVLMYNLQLWFFQVRAMCLLMRLLLKLLLLLAAHLLHLLRALNLRVHIEVALDEARVEFHRDEWNGVVCKSLNRCLQLSEARDASVRATSQRA